MEEKDTGDSKTNATKLTEENKKEEQPTRKREHNKSSVRTIAEFEM